MKKKICILFALSMALSACGAKPNSSSTSSSFNSQSSSSSSEFISSSNSSSEQSSSQSNSSSSESSLSSSSSIEEGFGYDYYNGYYGHLTWTSGDDLKQKLHDIIREGYQPLSYAKSKKTNWETNIYADHTKEDYEFLDVVYSPNDVFQTQTTKEWQREHAFAASLMTGSTTSYAVNCLGRATDFHNLFASAQSGNSSRQNKNFGVADKTMESYVNRTIDNGFDGYSFDEKTFEPGDVDKGRLARAIFYMATMYKDVEEDTANNVTMKGLTVVEEDVDYVSGNNCHFAIGHLSELLDWANSYDVDYLEMQHNESVYSHVSSIDGYAQGNRNPFVDYPDLVDYVFGSKASQPGDLSDIEPACLRLSSNEKTFSHYALKSAQRDFTYGEQVTDNSFELIQVFKDYSYIENDDEYTHSLKNHVFSEEDGESIEASIEFKNNQVIKYMIGLDPLKTCSYFCETKKNTISNSKNDVGVDQKVTYGNVDFIFNININYTGGSSWTKWTMSDQSSGGFKMGSSTYSVTKLTLTTVESYNVDAIYLAAYAANQDSSYSLSIAIDDVNVYTSTVPNLTKLATFGTKLNEVKSGRISYTFTGSNALVLGAVAFNVIEL